MISKILLVWVFVYCGGLLLAVVHPIYPLISYLTFYYAPPHVNWWGRLLPDLRFSLLASLVLALSVFLKSSTLERLKPIQNPAMTWLLLFGANAIIVTAWAVDRARSWNWTVALLKLILLYALIPAAVRTPVHFDAFSAAHIAGATYWGYKAWDEPKREAGRLKDVGGPDSQNENGAAAHLLTVIPFVAVYALTVKRRAVQAVIVVCGAFIVNVLILCNSRGATLGFLAMAGAGIAMAGRGRRLKLVGVALAGALALFALADNRFIERQQTTVDAKDASAQGRLLAWKAALRFIGDYPLGTGGRGFHILSPEYIPQIVESHAGEERSVHNTYLQMGAEWGIQGVITWAGFFIATFLQLERWRRGSTAEPWFFYRYLTLELTMVGILVAGVFSNRMYGESTYWMCALAIALRRMQVTAADPQEATAQATVSPQIVTARRAIAGAART